MIIKTKIESLDNFGRGIARIDNKIIFIENALPNEEVEIEVTKEEKRYLEGKVIKYIKTSKQREEPDCPYYNQCGGCNISHMTYKEQLKFKEETFINIVNRSTSLDLKPIVIESSKTKYYRNKITLKIENNKWGYYQNKTHKIINISNCLIAKESINNIINNQNLFKIKEGEIVIRSNYNDEILISITSNTKVDVDINRLKEISKLLGVIVNNKIIYGKDSFIELIDNKLFKVSINSFFQVNLNILKEIFKILSRKTYNNIIDLYCGVGTLGIVINKNKLFGIEISESSIKDALINSKMNQQNNNYYILGDSSKIEDIKEEIDMIIIDPPRSGVDKKTIEHILKSNVKNIIYMSCNPLTLSRDLNILKEIYLIEESYILDMFPQTYHIESLIIMKKK